MTALSPAELEAQATTWVMQRDACGNDPALEAQISAWVGNCPRRAGMLLRAEAAWALLDDIAVVDEAILAEPGGADARQEDAGGDTPGKARFPVSRRMAMGGAMAAGLAAVALPVALAWRSAARVYTTRAGEVRQMPLPDRSTIAINARSTLAVAQDARQRRVLLDDGEAWFHVAKDRARPFVVEAGVVRVQAVGTAFSVQRTGAGASVMVTEGTVRVWVDGHAAQGRMVSAGMIAMAGIAPASDAAASHAFGLVRVEAPAPLAELDRRLAWRKGQIDLTGETLAEAVDRFNRFNDRQIALRGPGLAGRRLYGVFALDDPDGFARTAAFSLGATVTAPSPGELVIVAR